MRHPVYSNCFKLPSDWLSKKHNSQSEFQKSEPDFGDLSICTTSGFPTKFFSGIKNV